MSIRAVGSRLFKHGQSVVRQICRRDYNYNTTIADTINAVKEVTPAPRSVPNTTVASRNYALRNVGLQFTIHAKRIFIDNVLSRVTNTLASDLRKRAARRILFGDSGPFLAFVGVSLASGTGILSKEDELEGVCWEIREAISKFKWSADTDIDNIKFETENITIETLEFGNPIAKGSNAVVYEAGLRNGSNTVVNNSSISKDDEVVSYLKYPLAVKMMFNYDIQSNAVSILQAMHRETVPAGQYTHKNNLDAWELELFNRRIPLPPHPNIVTMFSVFADYIPDLVGNRRLYPAALPSRILSEGEGRNMSLFLVMKRYHTTVKEYCLQKDYSQRVAMLLFAQLLEGVVHLNSHGIAHRDLKSDNLLLDTTENEAPILVITDFGCCLADKNCGLVLPYNVYDIDKGGNAALMAPEIINQSPGIFSVLDYSKSDLWTAGTIAYEIFANFNPFYDYPNGNKLKSAGYKDNDLPKLPNKVPCVIQKLIKNILHRNPKKRLDPDIAANVVQVFLWGPSIWLKKNTKIPSSTELFCEKNSDGTKNLNLKGRDLFQRIRKRIRNDDMVKVACFLSKFRVIVKLDLCYNRIGDRGIEILVDGYLVDYYNSLEHLNVMGCDITAKGIAALLSTVGTLRLMSLKLTGNKLGFEGGVLLSELLGKSETLLHLDVGDTDQTLGTVQYFMGVMRDDIGTINSIRIFDFSRVIPMSKKYQYESSHLADCFGEMIKNFIFKKMNSMHMM
ncbi:hypothetical protein FQA39_LY12011 [Lamprigera yunnana]|nr:hypothetical protein FQA39_LY12011 [Lamprigera yunnana]